MCWKQKRNWKSEWTKKYGNTQHNWITPWMVEDKYEYLAFLRFLVLIEVVEDYVYYIYLFAFSKSMSSLVLRFMYFCAFSKWIIFNVEVDTLSLTLWPCCQKVASNFNGFGFNCNYVANNVQCHTWRGLQHVHGTSLADRRAVVRQGTAHGWGQSYRCLLLERSP